MRYTRSPLSATAIILGAMAIVGPAQAASVRNGGFETGDFTDWSATSLPGDSGYLHVGHESRTPTEGNFAAYNFFDGEAGTMSFKQDVGVVSDDDVIKFDFQVYWEIYGSLDRLFNVVIEPAGGGTPIEPRSSSSATRRPRSSLWPHAKDDKPSATASGSIARLLGCRCFMVSLCPWSCRHCAYSQLQL